jgi:fructose-1-phosphate kinase PfkB-like protein
MGCTARPRLVKPNAVEAEEFTGHKVTDVRDAAAATQAFLAAGAQMAIISLGKDGAVINDGHHSFHVRPPAVKVKTTVGAGDALVTGALWALGQGLPTPDIGRWGVTVGTVTAVHDNLPPGAWPELHAIYAQVQVMALDSPA